MKPPRLIAAPTRIFLSLLTLASPFPLEGQSQVAGDWFITGHKLGQYSGTDFSVTPPVDFRAFATSELETTQATVASNGIITTPQGSGQWFFWDDFFYIAEPSGIRSRAVSAGFDKLALVTDETIDLSTPGLSNVYQAVGMELGLRLPPAPLSATDFQGTWYIFRQQVGWRSDPVDGNDVESFLFMQQAADRVTLLANGTFTGQAVLNTRNPGEVGQPVAGTWSAGSGQLQVNVPGQGIISQDEFSAGADLALRTERQSQPSGPGTFYEDEFGIWIKQAPTLTPADVVGRWYLAEMENSAGPDLGGLATEFFTPTYTRGFVTLSADGTGRISVIDTSSSSTPNNFSWSIVNNQLVATDSEGSAKVVVSAGKDFALLSRYEEDPISGRRDYQLSTLVKLPDVPGLAVNPPSLTLGSGPSGGEIPNNCIFAAAGLFYQLEKWSSGGPWQAVGPPALGQDAQLCVEDPAGSPAGTIYRWRIVPPPGN